jgi:hypothetical protein
MGRVLLEGLTAAHLFENSPPFMETEVSHRVSLIKLTLYLGLARIALGPTQRPIQWVPRAISLEVKRLGREADHSPPSSAEVKE